MDQLEYFIADYESHTMVSEKIASMEQLEYEIRMLLNIHDVIKAHGMSEALSHYVDIDGALTAICGSNFKNLDAAAACEGILQTIYEAIVALIQRVVDFFANLFSTSQSSAVRSDRLTENFEALTKQYPHIKDIPVSKMLEEQYFNGSIITHEEATKRTMAYGNLVIAYNRIIAQAADGKLIVTRSALHDLIKQYKDFFQKSASNPYALAISPCALEDKLLATKSGWDLNTNDFEKLDKKYAQILVDIVKYEKTLVKSLKELKKRVLDHADISAKASMNQVVNIMSGLGIFATEVKKLSAEINKVKVQLRGMIEKYAKKTKGK